MAKLKDIPAIEVQHDCGHVLGTLSLEPGSDSMEMRGAQELIFVCPKCKLKVRVAWKQSMRPLEPYQCRVGNCTYREVTAQIRDDSGRQR